MTPHTHLGLLPPGPARGRFAALGGLARLDLDLDLDAALREVA